MARLKFSNELFLDNLELQRFSNFIFENGWEETLKQQVESWGIVKNNSLDNFFDNFKVSQSTPILGNVTIQMQEGTAIAYDDSLQRIRIIKNKFVSPIPFPQDGNWYWVKIAPKYNQLEVGKVTIDVDGNMIGVGTKFTEILRGQPDFPSRVKFYKLQSDQLTYNLSSLNSLDYDILEVINDTEAILQGDFQNETDLYYAVQGTFTPGYIVPSLDNEIFQYDDCTIEFLQETPGVVSPAKPSYVFGQEFLIYRIRYDSGTLIIQDYRNELFKVKQDFEMEFIDNKKNPLIGIESIRYNSDLTPLDKNLVKIGWGFRSNTYTINSNLDKLTVSAGNGGKFKTPNAFTTGDFDGWRLYFDFVRNTENLDSYTIPEKYCIVKSSIKNGTSIDLLLDRLSLQDFIPVTWDSLPTYFNGDKVNDSGVFYVLLLTSATSIQPTQPVWAILTSYSVGNLVSYGNGTYRSLTNTNLGNQPDLSATNWEKVWEVYTPNISIVPDVENVAINFEIGSDVTSVDSKVNRSFDFQIGKGYAEIEVIGVNDDTITAPIYNVSYFCKNHKVYSPKQIIPSDSIGFLNELGVLTPYTSDIKKAFIKVLKNPNAYSLFKDRIDLGDNYGVIQIPDIEAFISPLSGRTYELVVGTTKQNVEFTGDFATPLTGDVKLNLPIGGSLKSGNRFYVYFNTPLSNGNTVGSSTTYKIQIFQDTSTLLYEFTQDELTKGQQFFILTYEKTIGLGSWQIVHFDKDYNGDSAFKSGSESVDTLTNIETVGGKNILVVSGYYETILLTNGVGTDPYLISGIRTLNGKTINNLKIINKAVERIQFENYTTYAAPPTGVLRFNFNLSDDSLRKQEDEISFCLDNTNLAYLKVQDNIAITLMDVQLIEPSNKLLLGTGSNWFDLPGATSTYTIPAGPKRVYHIIYSGRFTKTSSASVNEWSTSIRIKQNASVVGTAKKIVQQTGTLLISGRDEQFEVTAIIIANPGDVIQLQYALDFDDYAFTDIRFSLLGIAGQA